MRQRSVGSTEPFFGAHGSNALLSRSFWRPCLKRIACYQEAVNNPQFASLVSSTGGRSFFIFRGKRPKND